MTTYAGVDPGAIMTGVAVMDDLAFVEWLESPDPTEIWSVIATYAAKDPDLIVIVEPFTGTGRLNKRRIRTIEIVGYIYQRCREQKIAVERQPQQVRLPCVSLVPAAISGKDEKSAAAHVLAYRERRGDVPNYQGTLVLGGAQPNRLATRSPVRKASRTQLRNPRRTRE